MAGHACERLTEDQRIALRMTRDGLTSKEIAIRLGLKSKTAIDQRLDRARATLNAADRKAAARIHAEWEAARDRIIRDPEALVRRTRPATSWPSDMASAPPQADRIREEHRAFAAAYPDDRGLRRRLVRTALGGKWIDLTVGERLRWMAATVFVLLLATFLMFAAYESLQRTIVELS